MATDIMAKASLATKDADLQVQLGLKAFLQAVPRNIGRELRRRHFVSVKEALNEARFLQSVEEEESRASGKIFTVEADSEPSEGKPQMDVQKIIEACMKKMQAQQPKQEQSKRPRSRRKLRCWCGTWQRNWRWNTGSQFIRAMTTVTVIEKGMRSNNVAQRQRVESRSHERITNEADTVLIHPIKKK